MMIFVLPVTEKEIAVFVDNMWDSCATILKNDYKMLYNSLSISKPIIEKIVRLWIEECAKMKRKGFHDLERRYMEAALLISHFISNRPIKLKIDIGKYKKDDNSQNLNRANEYSALAMALTWISKLEKLKIEREYRDEITEYLVNKNVSHDELEHLLIKIKKRAIEIQSKGTDN